LTIEPLGKFTTEDSTYILTAAHLSIFQMQPLMVMM